MLYAANGTKITPKPPTMEIGRTTQAFMAKWGGFEANPDPVIREKGSLTVYEYERDTHLHAQLGTRKHNLISKGWRIVSPSDRRHTPGDTPGSTEAEMQAKIDFITWMLEDKIDNFAADLTGIMDCYGKGFSLSEKVWERQRTGPHAGQWTIKAIHKKPFENIRFRRDDFGHVVKVVNTVDNNREIDVDRFIHAVFGPDDENPYGEGLTSLAAFWVWIKKNQTKFWAIFNEKFAMPVTLAKVPTGYEKDAGAISVIDDFLDTLQSESGFRIPAGFEVEFLEATRRGDVTYDNFIERCNKEVSKVVLGQTLSSEEGKRGQGSYALGQAHLTILDIYVFFDTILMEAVLNKQLIKPICDFNYGDGVYPYFEFNQSINWAVFSQAVLNLTAAGVKVPLNWVYRTANIPQPGENDPIAEPPAKQPPPAGGNGVTNDGAGKMSAVHFSEREPDEVPSDFLDRANSVMHSIYTAAVDIVRKRIEPGTAYTLDTLPRFVVNMAEFKAFLIKEAIRARQKSENRFLPQNYYLQLRRVFESAAYDVAGKEKMAAEEILNDAILGLREGWKWSDFDRELSRKQLDAGGLRRLESVCKQWLEDVSQISKEVAA